MNLLRNHFAALLLFAVGISAPASAQQNQTASRIDDEVVKIDTTLIQIDVGVTDKNGKQIKDLKPQDFEIYENDEKQEIKNFSYVEIASEVIADANDKSGPSNNLEALPAIKLRRENVRRTIALVIDDLGLSAESVYYVRRGLRKFVEEQMQPNDLVAIIRTGGGVGALQQFTGDKRQLFAAIEKVRFNATGRAGVNAIGSINSFEIMDSTPTSAISGSANAANERNNSNQRDSQLAGNDANQLRNKVFTVGTLGMLSFVVGAMNELPGRKAIMLFSDGFSLFSRGRTDAASKENQTTFDAQSQRIVQALRRLIDGANRAAVVINTIDARGLQTLALTAADSTGGLSSQQLQQQLTDRSTQFFDTQQGMQVLAAETGGRAFINNNDIEGAVQKVLNDQNGYYLIGFEPGGDSFDAKTRRYNKLRVKVARAGATARYRSGFYGVTDDETEQERLAANKDNPRAVLFSALVSPFAENLVDLRLASVFGNDSKSGLFVRSLMHINAQDLKFIDEPDGTKKAVVDVVAYTFGDNGVPVDQAAKTFIMAVKDETYRKLLEKGLIYYMNVPVKKPGAYQLRVAVRDVNAGTIGSANQFVEVPNLKKESLALSGLVLQNFTAEQWQSAVSGNSPTLAKGSVQTVEMPDAQMDTAVRRFKRKTVLRYGGEVYNARLDAQKKPRVQTQLRLFRDGKLVYEGKPESLKLDQQNTAAQLQFYGAFTLGEKLEIGDYVLQIVAFDQLAKEKHRVASQLIEFEIAN